MVFIKVKIFSFIVFVNEDWYNYYLPILYNNLNRCMTQIINIFFDVVLEYMCLNSKRQNK